MVSTNWSEWLRNQNPFFSLTLIFTFWKALLVLITLLSPGPGYDTSTTLLQFSDGGSELTVNSSQTPAVAKFVRWDAIYFIQIAQRGHIFEQEWAFGTGISTVLSYTARTFFRTDTPTLWQIAVSGVTLSHLAHFDCVITMLTLGFSMHARKTHESSYVAFVTALLYIFSPAGIFLSAPYTEPLFAVPSLLGLQLYLNAVSHSSRYAMWEQSLQTYLVGVIFSAATMVRSNGILAGILFAIDAIMLALTIIRKGPSLSKLLRLSSVVVAGSLVGLGMVWPQVAPYGDYCIKAAVEDRREWCDRLVPSIFTFVQSHYWNVGSFRYWTLSNIPLFLLAAPALSLLIYSSAQCIPVIRQHLLRQKEVPYLASLDRPLLWRLAIPQLVLAVLALTSYHVQIITRLSSGYPLWYIWLAALICSTSHGGLSKGIFRWMIIYSLIQAGLYASFLPPA